MQIYIYVNHTYVLSYEKFVVARKKFYHSYLTCPQLLNYAAALGSEPVSGLFVYNFVPQHFRSRERKVHRENFRSRGTFAPGKQKVQELSFHGTFAPLELSLFRSECSKNFCSMKLSLPWNVRSTNNFRAL